MRDPHSPRVNLILYRALFFVNLLLILITLIFVILGLQLLYLPWILFGAVGFGLTLTLRRSVYVRWHYREIEDAMDHIHATVDIVSDESLGGDYDRLQKLFVELEADDLEAWDRQKMRREIQQLLDADPALRDACEETIRLRHPYFF